MKRFVHGLLAAMLIISTAAATTYSDKTFLMPRSHGMNLAMEYTTWHKQTSLIDDDKFGGTIQAVGFYEESENKTDLGQYFGVSNWLNGSNSVDDFYTVVPADVTGVPAPWHHTAADIFHLGTTSGNIPDSDLTLADKIVWRPYRRAYGVRLDYHQKLDSLLKGLFFKVTVPIVHVKTSMGWSSTCGTCASSCSTGTNNYCVRQKLVSSEALAGEYKSVADYLTGFVTNDDAKAKQVALCKAKIHNGKTETGIADIDIILGYNFLYKPTKHANINIGVVIPTGNTPDSEWLFEPVVGKGGHWALGFGMDSAFQLWESDAKSIDFLLAFNYRYFFSSTEKRIPGFVYPSGTQFTTWGYAGKRVLYGHWMLGAKKGDTFATPMANFLAQDVKVTPGSHFDGIAQFAFNYKGWTFDLGYNLYASEGEDVDRKCTSCSPCETSCATSCGTTCETTYWADDTYGPVSADWATDTAGGFAETHVYYNTTDWIDAAHLCFDACANPSVTTHKLYGGIGYAFKEWEYPLMLGIGGHYEWETDNDCLETWSLWAKLGLTF